MALGPLLVAAGVGLIAACFAEVGSQLAEAGGTCLYARVVYGQIAGIQIAWLAWLARLSSCAASTNIFLEYLGGFFPAKQGRWARGAVLLFLIGGLAAINILGVKAGAHLGNFLAAAEVLPLVIFVVAGLLLLRGTPAVSAAASTAGPGPKKVAQRSPARRFCFIGI
jgi:amino acid transporter